MKKCTEIVDCRLIEKIAGEEIADDITLSTLCVMCVDDPPKLPIKGDHINWSKYDSKLHDKRAWYIYKGNGLCIRHFNKQVSKFS